jgi:hypothetical protein
MEFLLVMQAKADARHEQMMADWKAWQEEMNDNHDETLAYQKMETCLEEERPTSVETKPEVEKQDEVPNIDAVVQPVKGRKRGKKQAAG